MPMVESTHAMAMNQKADLPRAAGQISQAKMARKKAKAYSVMLV